MQTTKRGIGAMLIALPMLLFGFLMFLFGYFTVGEWRSEGAALIACGVVWILTGTAALGSALWVCASLGRRTVALRTAGAAIILSGVVLATAATLGVLPCSGPA